MKMFQFFGAIDDQKRIQTLTGPEDVLERFFGEASDWAVVFLRLFFVEEKIHFLMPQNVLMK